MFHLQHHTDTRTPHRALAATATVLVTLVLGAGPSFASPEAGPPIVPATAAAPTDDGDRCPLARVGDEYVGCDNLTGNGVQAPAWVPER